MRDFTAAAWSALCADRRLPARMSRSAPLRPPPRSRMQQQNVSSAAFRSACYSEKDAHVHVFRSGITKEPIPSARL